MTSLDERMRRVQASGGTVHRDGDAPAVPAARQSSGRSTGQKFANDYLMKMAYGDGGKLQEERSLLAAAAQKGEGFPVASVDYTTKNGNGATYYPVMRDDKNFDQVVEQVATNTGLSGDEVLAQLGEPAAAEAAMRTGQNLAASHHAGISHAAERVATGLGADLIGEEPVRAAALKAMALEEEQLAKAMGLSPGNQPGGADAALPEWLPRMDNLAPWQTAAGYGAVAAGAGAASVALANHLTAKGQQQNDPVAHAAAMQAMNAY